MALWCSISGHCSFYLGGSRHYIAFHYISPLTTRCPWKYTPTRKLYFGLVEGCDEGVVVLDRKGEFTSIQDIRQHWRGNTPFNNTNLQQNQAQSGQVSPQNFQSPRSVDPQYSHPALGQPRPMKSVLCASNTSLPDFYRHSLTWLCSPCQSKLHGLPQSQCFHS